MPMSNFDALCRVLEGMDPETSESTSDTEVGLDMGNYPSTRTFTFTLKLGF